MEKLCNTILVDYLETHEILFAEQFGFRKDRSTSLAIFKYTKFLTDSINKQMLIGSLYVDFARAFDSINHSRLIDKLEDMGVPWKLVIWIEDYLNNRVIRTKLNNKVSNSGELLCGVPQGSILGPTLFLCYINDLVLVMRNSGLGVFLYADDAVIYHDGANEEQIISTLEQSLLSVINWCSRNYISINSEKTKFCIYGTRSTVKHVKCNQISLKDHTISRCHQYNYLGVLLDECLNLKANFNKIFKKYSYKIFQLSKIKRYISVETRLLVYKQTIIPLVEYVSFMLYLNNCHEIDKLQKLQNRCLRLCLNIYNPRDMSVSMFHDNAKVRELSVRRGNQLANIMYNLKQNGYCKKDSDRKTRSSEQQVFVTDIGHSNVYSRSPYYKGANLWNTLPVHIKELPNKLLFKNGIKRQMNAHQLPFVL